MLENSKTTELTRDDIGALLGKNGAFGDVDPNGWTVEGPVIQARRSDIYRAFHPDITGVLCVKCSKLGERREKSILQEYDNLHKYSSAMAGNLTYGVPRPVACLPEQGILVLEWVDGLSVKAKLASQPGKQNTRQILITQAASWLKEFHLTGGAKLTLFEPQTLADQLDRYLKKKPVPFEPCKKVANKACLNFRRQTERIPASQELHSFAHKDFTPGNIIVTADKVLGIDLTKNKRLPVFEDMTRFLADLTVNKSLLSVAVQIWLPIVGARFRQDEQTLRAAYLGETSMEKNNQFLLFLMFHMTKKMLEAAVIVSDHRQSLGFGKPFLLVFRYYRFWKRRLVLYNIRQRLKQGT